MPHVLCVNLNFFFVFCLCFSIYTEKKKKKKMNWRKKNRKKCLFSCFANIYQALFIYLFIFFFFSFGASVCPFHFLLFNKFVFKWGCVCVCVCVCLKRSSRTKGHVCFIILSSYVKIHHHILVSRDWNKHSSIFFPPLALSSFW